ncbi:hypothetical protein FEM48_Zijuj07G0166600 [Ziziphus jujuba var. spinosa]|uniref:Bulb-type lectin domain-containing protein n=1 Tax=Ziziphus jujuba var. spinosa TaxID=714518 RepID=A0A978V5R9_ZIZJJ|nr:hypothetical protein FEM48_Zijuj07G0166600 [Ziziphus jujuba var. spinosa]
MFFTSSLLASLFSWVKEGRCFQFVIYGTQSITGNSTLVSKDGNFEMGFFTPSCSTNRYVGIWYKDIPVKTVVWVANRQNPINDSSGTLMINSTGHLVLSQKNGVVWSTNPTKPIQAPMLQLLDSGNLVVRDEKDENSENYLWQSFDYPCDTLLPGMKLGWDLKTGLQRRLVSWKSSDDPFPGDLTWEIDINNYPEPVMFRGSENDSKLDVFATVPIDNCDKYALCGAYGNCIVGESPVCQCLKGFKPKGNLMDWFKNKAYCEDSCASFASHCCGVWGVLGFLLHPQKKMLRRDQRNNDESEQCRPNRKPRGVFFDLDEIIKATNNFSSSNKLGEGGFGSVYQVTHNMIIRTVKCNT